MPLPTVSQVQAVDPVLTNMLLGYMQDQSRFFASRVFPPVPVDKDSGTFYRFTKKYFFLDDLAERADGDRFAEIGFGVETSTYSTLQWAAEIPISDEKRKNSQLAMDLETAAVRRLSQASLIRKERAFSSAFMVCSVWASDATPTNKWSDYALGDPFVDIVHTAARTISDNTGYVANTLLCGHIVHTRLINHPDIIDRIKYVQTASAGNVAGALADIFGMANYWVSRASYNTANEAQDFSASAIIDDDLLVCYVSGAPGIYDASAGYTFQWEPGGGMGSIYSVRDDTRHADLVQHKEQWDQAAVATDLGYLFNDCVD